MKKRGISPLIATVLLIGFAIVLAALVWIFFSEQAAFYKEKATQKCSVADAASTTIAASACIYDKVNEKVALTVANTGQGTIDGFRIRLLGDESGISVPHLDTFEPGDERSFDVRTTGFKEKVIKSAEIIPFLLKDKKMVTCDQNLVKIKCN